MPSPALILLKGTQRLRFTPRRSGNIVARSAEGKGFWAAEPATVNFGLGSVVSKFCGKHRASETGK